MIDKLWEATLSRIIKKDKHLRNTVKKYGNDILNTPSYQQSKDFIQHGKKSVFQHSIDVAKMSLKISRTLPFQFKESELVRGALLHDYFLYDWHDLKISIKNPKDFFKLHGFTHANTALKNAKRDFVLSENEKEKTEVKTPQGKLDTMQTTTQTNNSENKVFQCRTRQVVGCNSTMSEAP